MTWVIDASVAAKWFLPEVGHEIALALLDDGSKRVAPDWILAEISHVAFKKWRDGEIMEDHARAMVTNLPMHIGHMVSSASLAERSFSFALRLRHPVYDCLYLACAEAVDGTVLTADKKLVNAVSGTSLAGLVHHFRS